MSTNQAQPQQRDVMYCHECENEWYRDEHGFECPECHSDFTEVIEADNDPREAPMELDDPEHMMYASDPDEDDIDNLQWTPNPPGQPPGMHVHGTVNRTIRINRDQLRQHEESGGQGGLMGLLGNLVQNAMGGLQQEVQQRAEQRAQQQGDQQWEHQGEGQPQLDRTNTDEARPTSEAGSPPPQGNPGGPTVRHISGPGYSMTIASSSTMTGNFGELFPRNAQQPQPFQPQPTGLEQMLHQMVMNIGAAPGSGRPMAGNFHQPLNFGNLFEMFGAAANGGVMGDAVYSQEALDRIVTQLMEQHQSGNAPGPASAAAISSLPKKTISKEDLDENGKADCSICMDSAEIGSEVTVLPCHHWFHFDCIEAWLSEHDTCPHCRQGIMPKEGENANRPRQSAEAPLNNMHSPDYQSSSQPPGAYPSTADGSRSNPFTVPDSPTLNRPSSSAQGGGMFSRMRDAFGSGNSGSGNADGGERPRSTPQRNATRRRRVSFRRRILNRVVRRIARDLRGLMRKYYYMQLSEHYESLRALVVLSPTRGPEILRQLYIQSVHSIVWTRGNRPERIVAFPREEPLAFTKLAMTWAAIEALDGVGPIGNGGHTWSTQSNASEPINGHVSDAVAQSNADPAGSSPGVKTTAASPTPNPFADANEQQHSL